MARRLQAVLDMHVFEWNMIRVGDGVTLLRFAKLQDIIATHRWPLAAQPYKLIDFYLSRFQTSCQKSRQISKRPVDMSATHKKLCLHKLIYIRNGSQGLLRLRK